MTRKIVLLCSLVSIIFSCRVEDKPKPLVKTQTIAKEKQFNIKEMKAFPKPDLKEILTYYQTSGVQENVPSEKYFNPDQDGLFVFYSLFDKKQEGKRLERIGTLVSHTYYKKGYGWDSEDTDQTFIELNLNKKGISVGKSIFVESNLDSIIIELGVPLFKNDSTAIFVSNNSYILKANTQKNTVQNLKYGRYNFQISPNETIETLNSKVQRILE